jgi:hypothetical protein
MTDYILVVCNKAPDSTPWGGTAPIRDRISQAVKNDICAAGAYDREGFLHQSRQGTECSEEVMDWIYENSEPKHGVIPVLDWVLLNEFDDFAPKRLDMDEVYAFNQLLDDCEGPKL